MATTAGRHLTALQYRQQLALRAQSIRDAHGLWRLFRPGDRASWDRMAGLARTVVEARYAQSALLAERYFSNLAALETGKHAPGVLADPLPPETIDASLVSTGLVGVVRARSVGKSMEAASQVGFVRFAGGLTRLSLMGGRATIVASVAASKLANGWTRITSDSPCAFCADLAGESSTPDAFQAHDSCACQAAPTFG